MVRLSHSYPWTHLLLFITETGNCVTKQTITSCHFQKGMWENVGSPHSTLEVNRQHEAFSLRGFRSRKWKWKESRKKERGGKAKVIWDSLTLILSNDSLLVISYSRSNAVKENGSRLVTLLLLSAHLCNTHIDTYTHSLRIFKKCAFLSQAVPLHTHADSVRKWNIKSKGYPGHLCSRRALRCGISLGRLYPRSA